MEEVYKLTVHRDLHPVATDGRQLEATFDLSCEPIFSITYYHKAGARSSWRSVNADYHPGLELLLARLAMLDAKILDITVDSSVARKLPLQDRRLDLVFPIHLGSNVDVQDLRLKITRSQKSVARRPSAKPGGGNDQKTIRLVFTCQAAMATLRAVLVGNYDGSQA